ncbi:hypothetical protein V3C99_015174 [Haemonchus contortus]
MRFLALLAACAVVASIEAVDPCKRQPFRGRCPSKNGESPKRSQFVLRYYMRNGECVSYPYGHCANDDSEPQLYRYKEECEDACINPPPANLGSPKSDIDQTYGTVGPVGNAVQPDEAAVTQTSAETTTQADNTSRSVSTQSPATTECERRRAAAAASTIRGGFVPACTAHGAFEKVQCEPDGRQCFCVDAKGIEIANSRTRNGQKPDCDGIQLSSAPKTKECVGGAARGPCSAALSRWYYDEQEAKCKKFTFSGCGGNGNNYDTEEACIRRCAPPPMGLPKCEKGEPLKTKLGVPVNCAKSDCPYGYKCSVVQQTSVCCPENNKIIGLQTSGSADVCSLPKERGPCDKYELRFYYNAELKECKYFFWGGCQGNKNNFEKVEDCEATCGIAKAKDSIPTTPAPSTQNQRLPFRTTQGIRITPGNFSKNEDGSIVESSTTVTSPPIAATAPGRVFTPEPKSAFESLVTSENIKSDPTIPATVHVAPTRAPPIPQMALLEGSEDNSANSVNRCLHPKDPGTCRGQFIRWYWDNDRKTCDVFTYTGCQGNGNNYASREECLAICHKEATPVVVHDFSNVCKHDVDAGECNGVFQRFAFDTESGECRPFTYGGCGGNGNNFATLAECRIKCQKVALSPGNLCEHDIEVGECSGVFVRFGYDKATNDCRQFTYGGCGGNGNNFATIQECRNVCIRKVCNPNPQCDLTRCQIVNDRNGCPFCSCPPTSQPSPPGALQCPEVNVDTCKEPCIIINNRKGCKDCVCPSLSGSIGQPPASFEDQDASPIAPSTSRPVTPTVRANHISARPPSAPTSVGPPSGPTPNRSSPPGTVTGHFSRRQESVPTVQSSQSKQVEIGSKQLLPPPLSAHLQEKCMQPVEPGPCKHFVDRWFFNGEDGTCHPFKYGGCAGNRNHFFSQNECEIHCARFLHRVPSVPSTPLHVHENENAADPDSKLSSAVQHSDDRKEERQRVPLSQPPAMLAKIVTTTTITTTTATTKRNIQVDRNLFSPVVTHSQSAKTNRPLDAASLPFDLPPSVRAHALPNFAPDNNKLSSLVTTTYYPETYEAWGIDLNRHPELGSDSQDRQRPPPLQREQVKVEEVARAATGRVTAEQHRNVEEQRKSSAVSPSITNFIHREQRPAGLVARESARSTTRKHLEPTAKTTIPTPRTVPSSTTRPTTLRERVYLETRTEATTRLSITKQRQNLGEFRNPPSERLPSTFSTSTERSQPQAVTNPNPRSTASKVQQIPEERFTSKPPHFSHSPTQSRPRLNGGNSETESILVRPLEPLKESIQPRADTVPPEAVQKTTPRSVVTERDRQVNAVLEEDRSSNELPPLRILEKPQLPRQQSVATHPHIYRTISIGSYNPQQNNNLAGLSPPVDPTYFTYNSQHLGGNRRQFAINNVPFTRQLPPMRTSWEPYPFRGQQARAMAPQTFSALTPEMQMRPNVPIQSNQPQTPPLQPPVQSNFAKSTSDGGLQHFSESTNIPSERDPNISNGAATTGAKNHQDGASLSNESQSHFAVQTDPNSERRTSDHVPMALNRGGTAETPVRQSGSSLFNNRAIPSSTGGGQSHTSATVQSPTRSADAPSSFQHRADPAPSLLMVQNEVKPTRRIIIEAKNSEFAQKAPIEPVGPAWSPTSSLSPIRQGSTQMEQQFNRQGSTQMEQQFNRQGSTQMEQQFNRNWAEQTQDTSPNQSNVPTAKQGDIKNVQHQSSSKRPIPQESELRKNGPSRNEFPKRIIENNRMVVSSRSNMISSIEQNVIESKRGWERANAQLNPNEVKNLRSFGSKLSPASDDDETEFPANIDRSRFIFYNGDYYAPTIPGVRIPRPDLENLPTNMQISTLEGPPTGMFRDFQRHSKEFQNVAPLGIKTHVASEDPLDIMNKSLYMKEAGTVISAPPVRVPDKRPQDMAGYSIGREPVPLSPTGIGRNMEKLDIDGLEEPTTIIPLATTTLPAATNATAATSTHAAATSTQATSTPQGTTGKQLSAEPSTTQTQTTLTSTVQTPTTGSPMTTTPALTTQPSTTQAASTQTSSTPPPPPPTTSTPTTQPPVTNAQTTPAPTSRPTPASSPVTTRATPQTTPQPTQPTTTRNVPRTAATVGVPTDREEIDARVLCALPPDAGPCFEYVPRWFFNAQSGQCEQFSYGSCGGNENNFADRSVCEIKCLRAHSTLLSHVPERCTYERDGGSGKGYNVKWYFNMKNLRCEQFVYEGRGGNQNQFETLSDCERYCSPQPGSPKYVIPPTTTTIRPPAPPLAPQTQPRPSAGQPLPDRQTIEDILDYDEKLSHFVEESVTSTNAPPTRPVGNTIDNRDNSLAAPAPQPPISNSVQSPATQPRPPAAQAAKTVVHKEKTPERSTNVATGQERRKEIYKAEPLPSKPPTTGNENLPIVGPSPPMSVNYQTGEVKNRASGIRTFQQSASRVIVEDSDLTEGEEPRRDLLSCPNGLKELRYADGRPVMCLPGKNQCPEKSVCYFNGVDFFCCPNEEDPYDKHVFGGYDGEETKHGYKVFGPLNIRRLMDEVPLRARREARSARVRRQASSNAFTAPQNSFSIDSITAPLRFDEEKPRTVSRAQRMRSNPSPPHHGNPICIEPLATGDCGAAHLRYYYDRDSDKCRLFYYTGCKGNNNNFGSMIDCQRLCVLGGQRPRPESDASTPPPVLRGQCPDGKSPLGGSAPVLCGNTTDSIGCPTGFFCLHGPPDICCPNGEVKRKVEKGSVRFAPEVPGVPRAHSRNVLLSTPKYMCPDASDPLMASNGEPTNCGAGFDGMKLCPKGFYCAIDVEKQSRMCCPLYGAAERVPTEQGPAPYLGRRPSNPGEVLERGSLPSDQSEYISRTRKEQMQERRRQMLETTTSVFAEESEEFEDGEEEEDEEEGMAHLMLKPAESSQPKAEPATSTALPESEDHHIIDLPTEPPTVEEAQPVKTAEDKSVCQIKPSEGRACREDEKPPRTNLHYFYSPKDRRCKLYFFRGCGGNANRFEKKADCERLCLS